MFSVFGHVLPIAPPTKPGFSSELTPHELGQAADCIAGARPLYQRVDPPQEPPAFPWHTYQVMVRGQ